MEKQIYFKKQPVKMGERVTVNDVTLEVNDQNIENNPGLFEVEKIITRFNSGDWITTLTGAVGVFKKACADGVHWINVFGVTFCANEHEMRHATKEEILEAFKKHYPKGVRFKHPTTGGTHEATGEYHVWPLKVNSIANKKSGLVFTNGKFAEIVHPLFTTEDGVDIYSEIYTKLWYVPRKNNPRYWPDNCYEYPRETDSYTKNSEEYFAFFSTREAAEAYIAKHKEKTLENYIHEAIDEAPAIMAKLRNRYPKLFYMHVLQKIADDLNGDWEHRHGLELCFVIGKKGRIKQIRYPSIHDIIFKSFDISQKAIEIMGDKLDYIYKS